jgi:hypothetical protein
MPIFNSKKKFYMNQQQQENMHFSVIFPTLGKTTAIGSGLSLASDSVN